MKKIILFFRVNFLFTDTVCALVIFFLTRFIIIKKNSFYLEQIIACNSTLLYPIFLNSGITVLGFLLTGISIIIIFLQSDKLQGLQNSDHPKSIINIYFSAIRWSSIFIILSFIAMIQNNLKWIPITLLVSLVISIIRLIRCFWIVEKVAMIIYCKKK